MRNSRQVSTRVGKVPLDGELISFHFCQESHTSFCLCTFESAVQVYPQVDVPKRYFNFNLQVSWIRHRDIHLLTVGRYTYTSDQRFEALHSPHSEEWTLRIKYPQRKDSGVYECQISTTPPVGHPVHLTVVGKIALFNLLN